MKGQIIKNIINDELCSSVLLDIANKSFEHEYDRTKRIEGKANVFIVAIGVILTILVGYLDLQYSTEIWKIICIHLFGICAITYLIAVIYFIRVLKLKSYDVLDYDKVFKKENLKCYKTDMEESLVCDYKKMLLSMKKGNDEKADCYKIGTIFAIVGIIFSFILIFIDFII